MQMMDNLPGRNAMKVERSNTAKPAEDEILLVTSGDLRLSANQVCWPAQREMEEKLTAAFAQQGIKLVRAHAYNEAEKHGFISSQRMGMDVFMNIHPEAQARFCYGGVAVQPSCAAGSAQPPGPILTVANWSGQWPGLVGLLNLNGSLVKAGRKFSSIWSKDFADDYFLSALQEWLRDGKISHDQSHVHSLDRAKLPTECVALGDALAGDLRHRKAIMGIFDEGCMGMYNAIIDDELLNPAGIYKERLSQSALVAKMRTVTQAEAEAVYQWLVTKGVKFDLGSDPAIELTLGQVIEQCKMYIAAVRIANEFGCDAIGIQYQQGLKDMTAASDLAEGMLNNADRPPVFAEGTMDELCASGPVVHFNEVDECAGVGFSDYESLLESARARSIHDAARCSMGRITTRGRTSTRLSGCCKFPVPRLPIISLTVTPGAISERQPAMYFPLGGGSLKGIGKPGEIVWSRVFVEGGALHADIGRGTVVSLPAAETERRWRATTTQWPIVHAVLHGVSQNQMMARHRANHVNIAYAPSAGDGGQSPRHKGRHA